MYSRATETQSRAHLALVFAASMEDTDPKNGIRREKEVLELRVRFILNLREA